MVLGESSPHWAIEWPTGKRPDSRSRVQSVSAQGPHHLLRLVLLMTAISAYVLSPASIAGSTPPTRLYSLRCGASIHCSVGTSRLSSSDQLRTTLIWLGSDSSPRFTMRNRWPSGVGS